MIWIFAITVLILIIISILGRRSSAGTEFTGPATRPGKTSLEHPAEYGLRENWYRIFWWD